MPKPTDCLFCESPKQRLILSLGKQPLANSYLTEEQTKSEEPVYPLDLYVCEECMLAHIEVVATSEDIFSDYAYFSSFSTTWLEHAKTYVDQVTERFGLDANSFVIEIASNDGYLLQNFVARGIPCLGIEPAENVAKAAEEKGVPTQVAFWGKKTAQQLAQEDKLADLIIGNNVLAHVPTLNDFVRGLKAALKPGGVVTMEFPHLYQLVEQNQFDTIYHEHFSYFSFFAVRKVFAYHGLTLFDVEELPTHGGSLRIYARHTEDESKEVTASVEALLAKEEAAGMMGFDYYDSFKKRVEEAKYALLDFLAEAHQENKRVAAYGAPAKGNTLLNYCGLGASEISYTVDRSPHKQGLYLPGSHIPIRAPEVVAEDKPDYLIILPWNLREEIMEQMAHIREWEGQFVVPIPEVQVYP
jgi:SAM-dependent methyltransferase